MNTTSRFTQQSPYIPWPFSSADHPPKRNIFIFTSSIPLKTLDYSLSFLLAWDILFIETELTADPLLPFSVGTPAPIGSVFYWTQILNRLTWVSCEQDNCSGGIFHIFVINFFERIELFIVFYSSLGYIISDRGDVWSLTVDFIFSHTRGGSLCFSFQKFHC